MTTAFVLAGGANLGAAQVGMLAALQEAGIRPDLLVGTSVGALNGAWVAGGGAIEDLGDVWRSLTRETVFPTRPLGGLLGFLGKRNHLVPNSGIRRLLREHLRFKQLQEASIPMHVVATEVLSGQDLLLSHGDAIEAILASSAIPGVLPPVRIGGRDFMDGGVVNNTPISHAVELGADVIWVLATGHSCALTETPRSALGVALHAVTLTIHQRLAIDVDLYEESVGLRVVPPLCPIDVGPTDFGHADELIDRAYAMTKDWLASGLPTAGQARLLEPHGHDPATGQRVERRGPSSTHRHEH